MTATSHPKRHATRLAFMETLGFFDSPSITSTGGATDPHRQSTQQVTQLVATGRHVKKTGAVVEDMWNTTQLDAPSLLDWEPQAAMSTKLGNRNFRWPIVLLVLALAAAMVGLGYWLYRRPEAEAATALEQVRAESHALSDSLTEVAPLVGGLAADHLAEANRDSSVFLAVGDSARALFTVSADLKQSQAKSAASESATLALDASKKLMDATAFRTALEQSLTPPSLETDPQMIDLTTAALTFSEWRSGLETVREALPENIASNTRQTLATFDNGLDALQNAYVDAMREGDQTSATDAVSRLTTGLSEIRAALLEDMSAISTEVADLIERSQQALADLVG
ncbi:MAG: hypothetical protein WB245_03780 [Acidimicrobiia bacterium]